MHVEYEIPFLIKKAVRVVGGIRSGIQMVYPFPLVKSHNPNKNKKKSSIQAYSAKGYTTMGKIPGVVLNSSIIHHIVQGNHRNTKSSGSACPIIAVLANLGKRK